MFDKLNLATEFSEALAVFIQPLQIGMSKSKAQARLQTFNLIFPWLNNFHIECDGPLRWLARNDLLDDGDIVFSRLSAAQRQIHSWVIEYVDGQRFDAANEE